VGESDNSAGKKPLTVSASYTNADGGMLLGFERREEMLSMGSSYPLWRSLTASVF
jgi:hypothetical protein